MLVGGAGGREVGEANRLTLIWNDEGREMQLSCKTCPSDAV